MSLDVRSDLAVRGVRVPTPVRRPAGAGPSDDGHVLVDGRNAALPINAASPYTVREGRVWLGETETGSVSKQCISSPTASKSAMLDTWESKIF